MTIDRLLAQLDAVRRTSRGWVAICPAHPDKSPSLSVQEGERGVLLKCWTGCTVSEICAALGLKVADLFFDAAMPRGSRPTPKPTPLNRIAIAFKCELSALDLRQRANRILEAGKKLHVATMTDDELDRALNYVASAHDDFQRAELFEGVADDVRERDYHERISCEQQRRTA